MVKIEKKLNQIIKFIKKYSIHFAVLTPFTIILLNLSQGSMNILKLPLLLIEISFKLIDLIVRLNIFGIFIFIGVLYYLYNNLNNFADIVNNSKKKRKKK